MKTNKGSGLVFAVILLFVILGMVVTLSSITVLETKMSQKTKSSVGAFYNSESGVEWALNKIASGSGTIASIADLNWDATSHYASCPSSLGGADTCKVYFLDETGTVITDGSLDVSEIKAVRSVGTQDTGEVTQRAIEAAVAAGETVSFTYYCNNGGSFNICANNGGMQGYCPSGFKQIYELGSWGNCQNCLGYNSAYYFLPPGGSCSSSCVKEFTGKAYVCSN